MVNDKNQGHEWGKMPYSGKYKIPLGRLIFWPFPVSFLSSHSSEREPESLPRNQKFSDLIIFNFSIKNMAYVSRFTEEWMIPTNFDPRPPKKQGEDSMDTNLLYGLFSPC